MKSTFLGKTNSPSQQSLVPCSSLSSGWILWDFPLPALAGLLIPSRCRSSLGSLSWKTVSHHTFPSSLALRIIRLLLPPCFLSLRCMNCIGALHATITFSLHCVRCDLSNGLHLLTREAPLMRRQSFICRCKHYTVVRSYSALQSSNSCLLKSMTSLALGRQVGF